MPVKTASQLYDVPTIPNDLRKEEAIGHIADSLAYLEKVTSDIFTRISSKVREKKEHLNKIADRVALAKAKVDKLKGSSKATKVFATAKYPSFDTSDYKATFSDADTSTFNNRTNYRVKSKHQNVDENVLKEKLEFYHVLWRKRQKENDAEEGLGSLPKKITSVSSLLLFNTSENPYKKYTMLDTLGVVTKTRTTLDREEAAMADAPETMMNNDDQIRKAETFLYIPNMGDVPEIAVPDVLPDLLGVADDLSYQAEPLLSIAPSVFGGAMPDLPTVVPDLPTTITIQPPVNATTSPSAGPPPPSNAAPPPPPPPPPGPPPPPPQDAPTSPPSQSSENQTTAATTQDAPKETKSEVPSADGGRENFLQSIRNSGGISKLKSTKDRKIKKKKEREEKPETGGDMMADLHKKLAMRRRGISGNPSEGSKRNSGSGSAMDKVSAMIPSPPKPETLTETEDEDWND